MPRPIASAAGCARARCRAGSDGAAAARLRRPLHPLPAEGVDDDAGFNVRNVDTLQIDTHIGGYRADAEGLGRDALLERFGAAGVTGVAASRMVPLQGGGMGLAGCTRRAASGRTAATASTPTGRRVAGLLLDAGAEDRPGAGVHQPRSLDCATRRHRQRTMAADAWPGQDPIGKRLKHGDGNDAQMLEIVGVARNANRAINEAPRNFIYVPMAQHFRSEVTFYVRRAGPESRINEMRQVVVGFNPMLPVIHTQTLEVATTLSLLPQTIAAWVAGWVGTIGLLLAASASTG